MSRPSLREDDSTWRCLDRKTSRTGWRWSFSVDTSTRRQIPVDCSTGLMSCLECSSCRHSAEQQPRKKRIVVPSSTENEELIPLLKLYKRTSGFSNDGSRRCQIETMITWYLHVVVGLHPGAVSVFTDRSCSWCRS